MGKSWTSIPIEVSDCGIPEDMRFESIVYVDALLRYDIVKTLQEASEQHALQSPHPTFVLYTASLDTFKYRTRSARMKSGCYSSLLES
jgi:hypothetical protein